MPSSQPPRKKEIPTGTFQSFSYTQLKPNPLNPRRLFDRLPLDVLKESIRTNGILVPITVYRETTGQYYIIDGERRWRCAEEIETDKKKPQKVPIPANVVARPSKTANILSMFNIHNLREQWELMPTALSLKILMDELGEHDDHKLSILTQLSEPNVRRCKVLLAFPRKYQNLMLLSDPTERVKANFFIELKPVLDLYEKLPKRVSGNKTQEGLVDHFLKLYKDGKIASVIHFRRILEAYDFLNEREDGREQFLDAAHSIATNSKYSIRQLFDPLVTEDRAAADAESVCRDFLRRMRGLKLAHTTKKRGELRRALQNVQQYVGDLIVALEG